MQKLLNISAIIRENYQLHNIFTNACINIAQLIYIYKFYCINLSKNMFCGWNIGEFNL